MRLGSGGLVIVVAGICLPASALAVCGDAACLRCPDDRDTCEECVPGWFARDGACIACTNVISFCNTVVCTNAGGTTCTSCAPGTYLQDGACLPCMPIPGCATAVLCNAPTMSQCRGCLAGYILVPGVLDDCVACPPGSFAPSDSTVCSDCGDCNDGDPCTFDSCDITRGCVHVRDPGCPEEPPPEALTTSGGGCNTAGLGGLAIVAAVLLLRRKATGVGP